MHCCPPLLSMLQACADRAWAGICSACDVFHTAQALDGQHGLAFHTNLPASGAQCRWMWESAPDVVRHLLLPAKLLGAFRATCCLLEEVQRGEQTPRAVIHVWWWLSTSSAPCWGRLAAGKGRRASARCSFTSVCDFLTTPFDRLFSSVTILTLSRWQCDPGTSVSQFWHVWVMLPPYSNIMWQAQHMFWKGLQFILAAPNLLDLFNPAFTLHHLNRWGCF